MGLRSILLSQEKGVLAWKEIPYGGRGVQEWEKGSASWDRPTLDGEGYST